MSDKEEETDFDLNKIQKEFEVPFVRNDLEELLRTQLTEYEMLESMFPSPGELSVDDHSVLADINEYLSGNTSETPRQLDYTITLSIDQYKLAVCVTLPLEYPNIEPDIFLRSEDLNRTQQRALNRDLADYVSTLDRGEICILIAISWLQEHALEYFKNESSESKESVKTLQEDDSFSRYWIYSHHIYSKIKCKDITDLALEYELTGFYLPGKPGIICVEGYSNACQEWWQKVKNMTWKKIACKRIEEIKLDSEPVEKLRKFENFRGISFESAKTKRQNVHMDFGEFLKYLKAHECEYIFKDCFGIDGK